MPNTHQTIGHGPGKVIALHGWFGSAHAWGGFAQCLDEQRFSYTFMDARGYGGMRGSDGPWTMEGVASDALALADSLGWERFALFGHSMAGVAIQHALLAAPERVRALVGVSPVSAAGVSIDAQAQPLFLGAEHDVQARRTIIDITTGQRLSGAWLDRMAATSMEHSDPVAVAAYFRSWSSADFVARVRGNPVPVLVVAGEHDPAHGPAPSRDTWMQHYPNARLQVLRECGHYAMDEVPVRLATVIEEFLAQIPA